MIGRKLRYFRAGTFEVERTFLFEFCLHLETLVAIYIWLITGGKFNTFLLKNCMKCVKVRKFQKEIVVSSILQKYTFFKSTNFQLKNSYFFCAYRVSWMGLNLYDIGIYDKHGFSQKGSMPILMQNSVCGLLSLFLLLFLALNFSCL